MEYAALRCGAFSCGDGPACRGGGDQHLAACGPHAAHGQVIALCGGASAGGLTAIERIVEVGLFDAHTAPICVELLGDHHGEHGLDTLTDLGGLGHDGDGAVAGYLDEGVRREVGPGCAELRGGMGKIEEAECKASTGRRADLQETSPRESVGSEIHECDSGLVWAAVAGADAAAWYSLADTCVGTATADVAVHRSVDLGVRGMGSVGQQTGGGHNLAGLAVAARGHIKLLPRHLDRMGAVGREALDGGDGTAADGADGGETGAHWTAIQQDRTCSASANSAAVLGAFQVEGVAQRPQKRRIG